MRREFKEDEAVMPIIGNCGAIRNPRPVVAGADSADGTRRELPCDEAGYILIKEPWRVFCSFRCRSPCAVRESPAVRRPARIAQSDRKRSVGDFPFTSGNPFFIRATKVTKYCILRNFFCGEFC